MRFTVHGTVTVEDVLKVNASNPAEALEIAGMELPGLDVFADGNTIGVEHENAKLLGDFSIEWNIAAP